MTIQTDRLKEEINARDAEIERLRAHLADYVRVCKERDERLMREKGELKTLIAELADELDGYIYWKTLPRAVEAVQKAREAVK